ncbi:zinc metalloproteinase nas-14-like [Hydractinia symbiolongicarpus]|uniref:zinc metalloproteinase nas-14-like n=1 Tax=Hydractinia symbiolongicarpus TaxID=13093 RepID=UPI00254E3662|nr:zinc metalloproteinase nas-14-like [Hydractinia symbiolongicarpus]
MRFIQLILCIAFICGINGSSEYEAAMDEIEMANQGEHYDQVYIKLTEEQRATFKSMNSKSRNKRSLYDKLYDVRWPEAVVPVSFSSDFDEAKKATINKAMRTIENVSCVRFSEYTTDLPPRDHVYIYKETGCWSYVGRAYGRQELSLGPGCDHVRTAIILLLHTLGFFNEHSRPDRDQYVTINTENIRPGYEDNFSISELSYKDGLGIEYDPESIMHYGRFTLSKQPRSLPTIEWKSNPNRPLGGRKMTASDILQLNLYYECKGYTNTTHPTTTTTTTTTTRPTTTTTTTTRPTTTTTKTTRPTTTTTKSSTKCERKYYLFYCLGPTILLYLIRNHVKCKLFRDSLLANSNMVLSMSHFVSTSGGMESEAAAFSSVVFFLSTRYSYISNGPNLNGRSDVFVFMIAQEEI